MRTSAEKQGSDRKWAARGALLVVLLLCGLLLAKCGDKPETVLSGDGGAAMGQESGSGEQHEPQGVEQGKAEAVMAGGDKEQAEFAGSVQQSGGAPERALSQSGPGGSPGAEQVLVQAQQLNPGARDPGPLAPKPAGQPDAINPSPQPQMGKNFPGELQAALEAGEKEAIIPDEERTLSCPGAPDTRGSAAVAEVPPGKTFTDPFTGMSFVLVKGGCFPMGSNKGAADEMPVHEVCVDDFYMGEYEVTQAQYEWIMGHNPSSFKGCGLPVESVSWEDAQSYIRRLNQVSGKNFRLPSEAEWEYAARSGWKDEPKSSVDPELEEYAWYIRNLGNQPVSGRRRSNGLGLYDMNCNVWEWVSDWYGADYYADSPRTNPQGPLSGSHRVIRAGNGSRYEPRFAKRYGAAPDENQAYFGFRIAFPARLSAKGLPTARKPEISDSADPAFQGEVSNLKVESASGPSSPRPIL